jgi:cell division protein FtsI/penicillin-binding protein 2
MSIESNDNQANVVRLHPKAETICDRQAKVGATLLAMFKQDNDNGDEAGNICDLITAIMHYATREGHDAIKEVRRGIWHWYEEHTNPENVADKHHDFAVSINIINHPYKVEA